MLKCSLSSDGSFSFQWILAQKYMYFRNPLKPRWRFVLGFIIALSTPCFCTRNSFFLLLILLEANKADKMPLLSSGTMLLWLEEGSVVSAPAPSSLRREFLSQSLKQVRMFCICFFISQLLPPCNSPWTLLR